MKSKLKVKLNFQFNKCYTTGTTAKQSSINTETYCNNLVRNGDYEHYLVSLFTPKLVREGYIALRAFNLETSTIKDQVSNSNIGQMRFLFWKETIDNIYKGNPPHQPVALELFKAIQSSPLSATFFKKVINEKANQFNSEHFNSIEDLDAYGENTASSLLYLHAELLGIRDGKLDHILSHLGKAIAITNLIRSLPYYLSNKEMIIPSQTLALNTVSQQQMYQAFENKKMTESMKNCIFEVATRANDHLITANSMMRDYQDKQHLKWGFPAVLSGVPTVYLLKKMEGLDFDIFDPGFTQRDWRLPYYLWKHNRGMTLEV
ncbi:hypothetical protein K502DRAFT_312675 [Neoconidiobolus thromboides FSU 785]|nr:hypothetical protein K502DRAFT_312675 [Neoconidiobolus thromboides FSU 785]